MTTTETLDELGERHRDLLRQLDELKPKLHAAMRAARAERAPDGSRVHTQGEIMVRSGYRTVLQVRHILKETKETRG